MNLLPVSLEDAFDFLNEFVDACAPFMSGVSQVDYVEKINKLIVHLGHEYAFVQLFVNWHSMVTDGGVEKYIHSGCAGSVSAHRDTVFSDLDIHERFIQECLVFKRHYDVPLMDALLPIVTSVAVSIELSETSSEKIALSKQSRGMCAGLTHDYFDICEDIVLHISRALATKAIS